MLPLLVACGEKKLSPEITAQLSQLETNGDLLVSHKFKGALPDDPADTAWQDVKEFQVPLVPQTAVIPRNKVAERSQLSVRALHNNKELALLLTWEDTSQDKMVAAVESFQDAVAVAFPLHYGDEIPLPYIGMGHKGSPVNIWQWRASLESGGSLPHPPSADEGPIPPNPSAPDGQSPLLRHQQAIANINIVNFRTGEDAGNPVSLATHSSPIENLLAEGFGTLTSVPSTGFTGRGVWQEGRWQVVIKRVRTANETGVDLKQGALIPISFAVWNGSKAERNGNKSITRWRFLQLPGEAISLPYVSTLAQPFALAANAATGKGLVTQLGCVMCHNMPGSQATQDVGPDLSFAGAIHHPEYLLQSIREPSAVIVPAAGYYDPVTGSSTMPSYEGAITEADLNNLVGYLRTLQ